jgi:beta-phosphoglucomutase-like phosphatase (HAD superfamily)
VSDAAPSLVSGIKAVIFDLDSRTGVPAGRAAGMRVLLVPNVSGPPGRGVAPTADAVLERLADQPLASHGAAA